MLNITGGCVEKIGAAAGVMPGDSVWLCSTHPKPFPTTLRGWLAPIRQVRGDSPNIGFKHKRGLC